MKVGLIDYGRGNLRSVEKALQRVGAEVVRVTQSSELTGVDAVVLPGVGSFGDAVRNLEERGLIQPVKSWIQADKPFLGICLGYQLLFESSEESPGVKGLGVFPGAVVRFPATVGKVPHMGWNRVIPRNCPGSLFGELEPEPFFYHVHSYYPARVAESLTACTTEYGGISFSSGLIKGNLHAFQFHPEKSQENGRRLLAAFVENAAGCPVA